MVAEDELSELGTRLRNRSWLVYQEALVDSVARGKSAESLLSDLLTESDRYRAPIVAAALGDFRSPGPADDVLRSVVELSGPGTADQRCASLLALAKRLGAAATDDFLKALATPSAALKDYALLCLAAVGDGRGWEQVFGYLHQRLRRKHSMGYGGHSPTVMACDYLIRHADGDEVKRTRLSTVLIKRWDWLSDGDRAWLAKAWPDLKPGESQASVALPSHENLRDWTTDPLFAAPATASQSEQDDPKDAWALHDALLGTVLAEMREWRPPWEE
jgi:hypothetical protein